MKFKRGDVLCRNILSGEYVLYAGEIDYRNVRVVQDQIVLILDIILDIDVEGCYALVMTASGLTGQMVISYGFEKL